ncbi:alcohol dehydrogenase, partial [Xanthomonas arboricola pv. pruni]
MPHARTFFHILTHQVLDLAGRNVGKHQGQV